MFDECVGVCDTWPGAGEGRKKDYLKARYIAFGDELKRSSTSFSSITTCESTAHTSMGRRDVNANYHSFSVSTLQCYEQPTDTANVERPLYSTKWMSTANQVPERQFGAGSQVPSFVLHLADNPIPVRISVFRFLLILFLPQSVQKSPWIKSGFGITFGSLSLLPFTASYSYVAS
jgi:hypothetical protein